MLDRYPTTHTATCETCGWKYSVTNGVPDSCPACERKQQQAALDRVLRENKK